MEKSFPKIESELNSRPDGFLSHVYVYSDCSHYLQNRQEGYLAFDKKKYQKQIISSDSLQMSTIPHISLLLYETESVSH